LLFLAVTPGLVHISLYDPEPQVLAPLVRAAQPHLKPFEFQLVSDLHSEHLDADQVWTFPTLAPVLVLAGDVGCPQESKYGSFLVAMSIRYEQVFLLAGNHEFYGDRSYHMAKLRIQRTLQRLNLTNVMFMDRSSFRHSSGVRFLGVTLWSNIPTDKQPVVQRWVSDYHSIFKPDDGDLLDSAPEQLGHVLSILDQVVDSTSQANREEWHQKNARKIRGSRLMPADTTALHLQDLAFLEAELSVSDALNETVVVLSHHTPVGNLGGVVFFPEEAEPLSPLSSFLGTDLRDLVERHPSVAVWGFGHTHQSCDFLYEFPSGRSVRFVSNQAGYPNELLSGRSDFRVELVLQVPHRM